MSGELVPQVEAMTDVSVVVDERLRQVLRLLGRSELAELSQVVAELNSQVILSAGGEELRALRDAADASDYEWRPLEGEVVLSLLAADESNTWLAEGLVEQVLSVPTRWRHDVASALFSLISDLEDDARSRHRRLVLGLILAGAGAAGLIVLGLLAIAPRARR